MRKIFFLLSAVAVIAACSCSEAGGGDAAARAAKEYYDSLFAGNAGYFVRGTYLADTIPPDYHRGLEDNAMMFAARQNEEHRGIKEIRVMRCTNDTVSVKGGTSKVYTSNAFLVFCYGDSLNEEIVVQMIKHKGRWLMR